VNAEPSIIDPNRQVDCIVVGRSPITLRVSLRVLCFNFENFHFVFSESGVQYGSQRLRLAGRFHERVIFP